MPLLGLIAGVVSVLYLGPVALWFWVGVLVLAVFWVAWIALLDWLDTF
jgi:hypothetical protein